MIRYFAVICLILILAPTEGLAQKSRVKKARASRNVPAKKQVTEPATEPAQDLKALSDEASKSRTRLLEASESYRESLDKLLALQKKDAERVQSSVEKNRKLLEMGLIARRQLDESELELASVNDKLGDVEKQILALDNLVAEVRLAEEADREAASEQFKIRSTGRLVRYVGSSRWAMSDFTKVDAFFRLKFGKPLPVSAFGQTHTHNRLGFDHREAIDVAVHPDSEEGQELINYLASQGISFIAIRGPIAGSATGAHIHIGPSSKRIN
ncbi:MAG: hypothetical protein AB7H86_19335 [Blastocatellales bacterium]